MPLDSNGFRWPLHHHWALVECIVGNCLHVPGMISMSTMPSLSGLSSFLYVFWAVLLDVVKQLDTIGNTQTIVKQILVIRKQKCCFKRIFWKLNLWSRLALLVVDKKNRWSHLELHLDARNLPTASSCSHPIMIDFGESRSASNDSLLNRSEKTIEFESSSLSPS